MIERDWIAYAGEIEEERNRLRNELTEARALIAASEQEHQDFRLQNDAEWRAKLDHLKAQIAAKDAVLRALRWKSIDKDNMEFQATITYSEMDAIRAALAAPARET